MSAPAGWSAAWRGASKYRSKRCECDGRTFASKRERDYYLVLKRRLADGEIKSFSCQYSFSLLPALKEGQVVVYRLPLRYIADFVVTYPDGRMEVVDVKGFKTDVYLIKKRLMRQLLGVEIVEV